MAEAEKEFPSRIDVNDECFMAPIAMIKEIQSYCSHTGQRVPESAGELAAVIYQSLAECYAKTAQEIETITGRAFDAVYIVGGGSNADYLNHLTAVKSRKAVYAGPDEASAIGNLAVQMIASGEFKDLQEVRNCIHQSFDILRYDKHGNHMK